MSRQQQWHTEKRSYGLRAWRKSWARVARRRRDREASEGEELDEFTTDSRFRGSVQQMRRGERSE